MILKEQKNLQQTLKSLLQNTLTRIKIRQQRTSIDSLQISNHDTRFQLTHGNQFKTLLDPRDQVLQHQFNKIFSIDQTIFKANANEFIQGNLYKNIIAFAKKFLVEAVSNIVSIAFNYLINDKLQEKQAMCFAAKNIVLNIQSLYREIIKAIKSKQQLVHQIKLQDFKVYLIKQIDAILVNIFLNLQDHYPQAPATGGTQRMKSVINQVDRVDDQENDLIYSNNIRIKDFIRTETIKSQFGFESQIIVLNTQDHTDFIMKVINTAITVPQQYEQDKNERTAKQIFSQFNQHLIWTAYNKEFNESVKLKSKLENQKTIKLQNSFLQIFESKSIKQRQTQQSQDHSLKQKINKLQQLKLNKKFQLGQKIPSFVKPFNKQELNQKKFTAKHSSILRILTKWSEYLQDVFINTEKHIKKRLYPFKNINNQLCTIADVQAQNKLINQLKQEYKEVKCRVEKIKQQIIQITSQLFCNDSYSFASNVCRFQETRKFSSRINFVLTSIIVDYLSILIHHLLKAGQGISTMVNGLGKTDNINLIVFRVSDLLRSKLQCNQTTFINMLETIYMLDENQKIRNKFKLVRIKNKLQDPANNIMINFMFMGKVQCELQLSIQEAKGKQKRYYAFSHFLYEIMRGKFGPISECAIMISQLDPMINSCRDIYYHQKQIKRKLKIQALNKQKEQDKHVDNQKNIQQNNKKQQKITTFQCKKCQQIVIVKQWLYQSQINKDLRECRNCLIIKNNPQNQIKNQKLKQIIFQLLKAQKIIRVRQYNQLCQVQHQMNKTTAFISLNQKEQLQLALILYHKKQLKYFFIKINNCFLYKIKKQSFDFSEIDYIDISKKITLKKPIEKILMYKIVGNFQQIVQYISQYIEIKETITDQQIQQSIKLFQQYRLQKSIIKSIKFKTQILNYNQEQQIFETFQKIVNALVINQGKNCQKLKYKKYNRLQLSRVKIIQIKNAGLTKVPQEINFITNLVQLILQGNQISFIPKLNLTKLTHLNIWNNKLTNIDLSALCNLTLLNLGYNNLQNIDLSALENITLLNLKINQITNVDLSTLKNLTQLYLQNNQLQNIDLSKHSNLIQLHLNGNFLTNIDISSNINLIQLGLTSCKLTMIDLSRLSNLIILRLGFNKLTNVDLSALVNLTQLQLQYNQLTDIDLTLLGHLNILNLQNNKLEYIKGLSELYNLTQLNLYDNKLTDIGNLQAVVNLSKLILSSNELNNINISSLCNLTKLDLYQNNLKNIEGLSAIQLFTKLDLKINKLASIDLSSLVNLTQIQLQMNQLQNIDLSTQDNLIQLDLSLNKLTNIEGISVLRNLTKLNLQINQLTNINLSSLINLTQLDLSYNKLTSIDLSVLCMLTQLKICSNKLTNIIGVFNCSNLCKIQIQMNSQQLLIQALPTSIRQLSVDVPTIIKFNFEKMVSLANLKIFQTSVEYQDPIADLININEAVQVIYQRL